jgi:ATP-dependent DNA helicase RecQ
VVAAINYLEEQGDLTLQVAGVRQGFRRLTLPRDPQSLTREMAGRFADREQRDLARLAEVTRYVNHDGCLTRTLLAYFGEPAETDCGHCGPCRGHHPGPLPPPSHRTPGEAERAMVAAVRHEHGEVLTSPRPIARVLCGITSPRASRARLTKDPRFGALSDVPFREVLALAEQR